MTLNLSVLSLDPLCLSFRVYEVSYTCLLCNAQQKVALVYATIRSDHIESCVKTTFLRPQLSLDLGHASRFFSPNLKLNSRLLCLNLDLDWRLLILSCKMTQNWFRQRFRSQKNILTALKAKVWWNLQTETDKVD